MRGARFILDRGERWPAGNYDGNTHDWRIARGALTDVRAWLGFATDDEYTSALQRERAAIFNRAPRRRTCPVIALVLAAAYVVAGVLVEQWRHGARPPWAVARADVLLTLVAWPLVLVAWAVDRSSC